jgi:cytochrome bd-type quinol oxidase subunit 2
VRWAAGAALLSLFTLVCVVGRLTTYFVLIAALLMLCTPSVAAARRQASRNPVDLAFLGVVLAMSIAFVITTDEPSDLSYIFNFVPLLLAIPFRWQLERHEVEDIAEVARLYLQLRAAAAGHSVPLAA